MRSGARFAAALFLAVVLFGVAGTAAAGIVFSPTPTATPTFTPTFTPTPTATLPPPTSTATRTPTVVGGGPGNGPASPVPTLSPSMLALLAVATAGAAVFLLRRSG